MWVRQLEVARDKIGDLTSALADMTDRRDALLADRERWSDHYSKLHASCEDWKKRAEELESRFGDLRQKHLDVKLALAEREGYIARVNEQEGRPLKGDVATPTDAAPQIGDHPMGGTAPFARAAALDRIRCYAGERDYLRKHWVY
jgi:hypothetical protein